MFKTQALRMRLALAVALLVAPAAMCNAQVAPLTDNGAIIRGVVQERESGLALAYAIVSIPLLDIQVFANERGNFVIPNLRAGTYLLRVRQLGYSPAAQAVTVADGEVQVITVLLSRVATRLAAMRVQADWTCQQPGRPKAENGAMVLAVFEQLEQNALRLQLLSRSYPFVVDIQRTFGLRGPNGADSVERTDMTMLSSADGNLYREGRVVREVRTRNRGGETYMHLPTLLDFANNEFQKNHCFIVRGIEEVDGLPYVRVDFKASAKIKAPDVDGSVYLDTANFRLRRTVIRLTRIPPGIPGLLGVEVTTRFVDLRPGLPVLASVHAENALRSSPRSRFNIATEDQIALNLRYLKQRPDSLPEPAPPSQYLAPAAPRLCSP